MIGKVLKRLHIFLSKDDIDDLVQCRPGAVEHLLVKLQLKARTATIWLAYSLWVSSNYCNSMGGLCRSRAIGRSGRCLRARDDRSTTTTSCT